MSSVLTECFDDLIPFTIQAKLVRSSWSSTVDTQSTVTLSFVNWTLESSSFSSNTLHIKTAFGDNEVTGECNISDIKSITIPDQLYVARPPIEPKFDYMSQRNKLY